MRQREAERVERERARAEEDERRRREELERHRFETLRADALKWNEAQIIRGYIEAVRQRYASDPPNWFAEWIAWASERINQPLQVNSKATATADHP